MPANNRRYWYCGGRTGFGHVVGEISHKDINGIGKVTALLIYDKSLPVPPSEIPPDRGMVITGFGMRCTICSNTFDWYPSLESLNKLLFHYKQDV